MSRSPELGMTLDAWLKLHEENKRLRAEIKAMRMLQCIEHGGHNFSDAIEGRPCLNCGERPLHNGGIGND